MNDKKLTWEETICFIRTRSEYDFLVEKAYFDSDLKLNVERFRDSDEFKETINLLKLYHSNAINILDIGSGNGISAIAFALEGYNVVSMEPDPSEIIGAGAIRQLKGIYGLSNLEIIEGYAEDLNLINESFDIVYTRQCMHHANNLWKFVQEASRVLRRGGILLTTRDHVIFNENDKKLFLKTHPLQKFYGGENAFTSDEYKSAIISANLDIVLEMKYFDSVINFFPSTKDEIVNKYKICKETAIAHLNKRIGFLSRLPIIQKIYCRKIGLNKESVYDEKNVPGRMYSYLCIKK